MDEWQEVEGCAEDSIVETTFQQDWQKYKSKLPVDFGPLTEKVIEQLKALHRAIFPGPLVQRIAAIVCKADANDAVRYNDKFYTEVLNAGNFTKLAYYSTDILVGAICSRIERKTDGAKDGRLYIMTLGVLAPYRSCGIGTKLLTATLDEADQDNTIDEVYLHVQTSNSDALDFYKRFGFEQKEKISNYYKRIDPPDCYVMSRRCCAQKTS